MKEDERGRKRMKEMKENERGRKRMEKNGIE